MASFSAEFPPSREEPASPADALVLLDDRQQRRIAPARAHHQRDAYHFAPCPKQGNVLTLRLDRGPQTV